MRKNKIKILRTKADKLLQSKRVLLNPSCFVCGGTTSEMHHFVPKGRSNNLRYYEKNLIPLCRSCHARHHLSGDPEIHAKILFKMGEKWFDDLQVRRRIICKLNVGYLEEVIKRLE